MEYIPVVSLNTGGLEKNPGFKITKRMVKRCIMAMVYGDLLMRLTNAVRPYEKNIGATNKLLEKWLKELKSSLTRMSMKEYHQNICSIVREFETMEILDIQKPKVGVVGEILVKFHPFANNYIVDILEKEGAEAVVPDLLDFFLYSAYQGIYSRKKLSGTFKTELISRYLIWTLEKYRRVMKRELKRSKRFHPPKSIFELADMTQEIMHLGHQSGEGWFLTAEMLELIESGASNIACLQPFACLPNHITGKGMVRELKRRYPQANIVPVDYDPGSSQVNQVNRIKLMLSVAFKNMEVPEESLRTMHPLEEISFFDEIKAK